MQAKNDSATALSSGVPGLEKEDFTFKLLLTKCWIGNFLMEHGLTDSVVEE